MIYIREKGVSDKSEDFLALRSPGLELWWLFRKRLYGILEGALGQEVRVLVLVLPSSVSSQPPKD